MEIVSPWPRGVNEAAGEDSSVGLAASRRANMVSRMQLSIANMDDVSKLFPGATPQHETVLNDAPSFVEACRAQIADDAERIGWRFGKSIVTRSKEWGLVWRVDLLGPAVLGRTQRIVCWRQLGSTDVGFAYVYVDEADRF